MPAIKSKYMKLMYLFAAVLVVSCNSNEDSGFQKLVHKPLNEFVNDTSIIREGDKVQLLGFSGFQQGDKDYVYYSQIIVKKLESGDTISVLCPLLKIPEASEATKIYIMPNEFNPDKGITEATYNRKSDSLNFLMQVLGSVMVQSMDADTGYLPSDFPTRMTKKEMVVCNKSIPLFQNNYKTVVGVLEFESDPR